MHRLIRVNSNQPMHLHNPIKGLTSALLISNGPFILQTDSEYSDQRNYLGLKPFSHVVVRIMLSLLV